MQALGGVYLKLGAVAVHIVAVETGIEWRGDCCKLIERDIRKVELLRDNHQLAEGLHTAQCRVYAINTHLALLWAHNARNELKERGLADAVATEQSVNMPLVELKRDIVQHGAECRIPKRKCLCSNHSTLLL